MKNLILFLFIFFLTNTYAQQLSYSENVDENINPSIDAFIGDWVGTGWGWEIRFKQSAGEFGKQFARGKLDLPFENEKIIMSIICLYII